MASGFTFYSEEPLHTHSYLWPRVLEQISCLDTSAQILDAGCGTGDFAAEISKLGYQTSGFDISESGIEIAKKRGTEVDFKQISAYDDFGAEFGKQFDAIVSLEVVEHLYDPKTFVANCYKALKPGGILVLTTPYHGYLKNCVLAASGKMDQHFTALWDHGHIKFWSRPTITKLLETNNLKVEKFIGTGRLPYVWKSMILVAKK